MKSYKGDRTIDGVQVWVDEEPLDPGFHTKVISAEGFEWSYEGASPAQLAFALLLNHCGDAARALANHKAFMEEIVANFNNEWEMTSADIEAALCELEKAE